MISYATWWQLTGIDRVHAEDWFWSPKLYDLALVWLAPGVVLLAGRAFFTGFARGEQQDRVWVNAFDRVVMRSSAAPSDGLRSPPCGM